MYTLLVIIHLFVSFVMIGAILLQAGKGAEIGAAFGGSSQTIFGSRGAATFLSKMTVGAAIIFMLTSLSLAFLSKERAGEHSIMKNSATETGTSLPLTSSPNSVSQKSQPAPPLPPQASGPINSSAPPTPPIAPPGATSSSSDKK